MRCGGQLTFPGTCESPYGGQRCGSEVTPEAGRIPTKRQFMFLVRESCVSFSLYERSERQARLLAALALNVPPNRLVATWPSTDGFRRT